MEEFKTPNNLPAKFVDDKWIVLENNSYRNADIFETRFLNGLKNGEVTALACDYASGEWMGGVRTVPVSQAWWAKTDWKTYDW